jgi:hypothetical protein
MKRILIVLAMLCAGLNGFAQDEPDQPGSDSTDPSYTDTIDHPDADTIRIGTMIIIRSGKDRSRSYFDSSRNQFRSGNPNVTTNWMIVDIGVSQVNDQTNYAQAISSGYLPAGANENWFDQRTLKSTNVNIWIFMQRLNMIKHVVNLKYGIGVELNNFKYTENIRFRDGINPLVIMENVDYKKNKLATDYITVPLMLNFNFTPRSKHHGFGLSAGVSGGYLYSSRQKTVGGEAGKKKERDDFDLQKFKLAYIAELSLGPVRVYGSYATRSMFKNALDQTPYSFGLRLSNW